MSIEHTEIRKRASPPSLLSPTFRLFSLLPQSCTATGLSLPDFHRASAFRGSIWAQSGVLSNPRSLWECSLALCKNSCKHIALANALQSLNQDPRHGSYTVFISCCLHLVLKQMRRTHRAGAFKSSASQADSDSTRILPAIDANTSFECCDCDVTFARIPCLFATYYEQHITHA